MEESQKITEKFSFVVNLDIEIINNTDVHIDVPTEIRLTRPLLSYLAEVFKARGLELKHLNIKEPHKRDLNEMTDATVEENEQSLNIKF